MVATAERKEFALVPRAMRSPAMTALPRAAEFCVRCKSCKAAENEDFGVRVMTPRDVSVSQTDRRGMTKDASRETASVSIIEARRIPPGSHPEVGARKATKTRQMQPGERRPLQPQVPPRTGNAGNVQVAEVAEFGWTAAPEELQVRGVREKK